MVIGDIASAFGCTISMKDQITAITFVAIGTSIPGLFVHQMAALLGWPSFTQRLHSSLMVAVVV